MRSAQGIIIGSVGAAVIATLGMAVVSPEVPFNQIPAVVFVYSLVGSIFAVVSAFLFGWPLSLLYKRLGFASWWQYCFGGAFCAFPFWVAWFYPFNGEHWEVYRVSNSVYFYSVGIIAGYIYWWCVVRPINKSKHMDGASAASV
ncbi:MULTISPECIES: hypothetical protein [Microbulbifer]|uniref:hypothetical protein n=1 Tax=Microbulbifer TaxID=48073 RepID=UPI0011438EC6|nr:MULTISPECIES: hypothetical protein [Microbulbifer]